MPPTATDVNRLQLQIARALQRRKVLRTMLVDADADIACRRRDLRHLKARTASPQRPTR